MFIFSFASIFTYNASGQSHICLFATDCFMCTTCTKLSSHFYTFQYFQLLQSLGGFHATNSMGNAMSFLIFNFTLFILLFIFSYMPTFLHISIFLSVPKSKVDSTPATGVWKMQHCFNFYFLFYISLYPIVFQECNYPTPPPAIVWRVS